MKMETLSEELHFRLKVSLRVYQYLVMFLKEVFYAHQGCIYLVKNTANPKYYYI